MTHWLPFALAIATLFVALWIFLPGPTYLDAMASPSPRDSKL